MGNIKKIKKLVFEVSIEYDDGKEPFKNQQLVAKIRNAFRQQITLMDEDGQFGKYQGNTAIIKTKLKSTECEE